MRDRLFAGGEHYLQVLNIPDGPAPANFVGLNGTIGLVNVLSAFRGITKRWAAKRDNVQGTFKSVAGGGETCGLHRRQTASTITILSLHDYLFIIPTLMDSIAIPPSSHRHEHQPHQPHSALDRPFTHQFNTSSLSQSCRAMSERVYSTSLHASCETRRARPLRPCVMLRGSALPWTGTARRGPHHHRHLEDQQATLHAHVGVQCLVLVA